MNDHTDSWIVIEENHRYFAVNIAEGSKHGPFPSKQKAAAFVKVDISSNAATPYNIECSDEKWHP